MTEQQKTIEQLLARRRPFDEIEDEIDAAPITGEQKAALWLLAWTYQPRRFQRRIARETLAALS